MSIPLNETPETLQTAIDRLFRDMANTDANTPEYAGMVKQMDTLYKLKDVDQKIKSSSRVSPDTIATIAANLAGIVLIVGYERAHVLRTEALKLIEKIK